MKTCIELAETLGARVGRELEIPVYLYGRAAKQPQRESLAVLRHGQYESLQQRLSEPRWLPDAGPARWSDTIARGGSIQIGARPFLIAWNINLETRDARIASKIAARIRTSGDGKECAGMFPELKARGWYMAQFGCAQVTMNLTDYSVTPLHSVFTAVSDMAREFDTRVTGSELVGLIPRDALLAAGRYFARTEELTEHALIETAVDALGLSQLSPFLPGKRILEQCLEN